MDALEKSHRLRTASIQTAARDTRFQREAHLDIERRGYEFAR
jgi:hypothetical protein